MKNKASPIRHHRGFGSEGIAEILHVWSNLILVKIKHGRRSQVLSGVIGRAETAPAQI